MNCLKMSIFESKDSPFLLESVANGHKQHTAHYTNVHYVGRLNLLWIIEMHKIISIKNLSVFNDDLLTLRRISWTFLSHNWSQILFIRSITYNKIFPFYVGNNVAFEMVLFNFVERWGHCMLGRVLILSTINRGTLYQILPFTLLDW